MFSNGKVGSDRKILKHFPPKGYIVSIQNESKDDAYIVVLLL
jgi:hypothetical protein